MVAPPVPSYMEDPDQRLLYRARTIFLAVGVVILAVVFIWSVGQLVDSIGASLDAIFGNE